MKMVPVVFLILLAVSVESHAENGITRPLSSVYEDADTVVSGLVVSASLGSCAGENPNAIYLMRVRQALKGDIRPGRKVKLCGPAPILISENYIIAGKINKSKEIVFSADAVVLAQPRNTYFRLISYDTPYVTSELGKTYGIGIEEPDFFERFGKKLGIVQTAAEKLPKLTP
ncbi:hypothetical protein J5226_05010 [Lysobacter sp. K5869]|uniref:hypothetical protein n=1 Tax=Lysobacter sp. K5869 TaxID=2820808 RepID=UPI001C06414D|nr:hypothetical protein [Lysobacter sp. K5869]QWP77776.1 hypothetical protein J5226_05010 [Lysobacter sp. K5869]